MTWVLVVWCAGTIAFLAIDEYELHRHLHSKCIGGCGQLVGLYADMSVIAIAVVGVVGVLVLVVWYITGFWIQNIDDDRPQSRRMA
jgi:hypothetical protein